MKLFLYCFAYNEIYSFADSQIFHDLLLAGFTHQLFDLVCFHLVAFCHALYFCIEIFFRSFDILSSCNCFQNQSGFDSALRLRFYLLHHVLVGKTGELEVLLQVQTLHLQSLTELVDGLSLP